MESTDDSPMLFEEEKEGFSEGFVNRERSYSRTMTVTSNEEAPNPYLGESKQRKLFGLPVKHGVTRWNLMAIVMTPLCVMLISTYLNAQIVLLLATPGFFNYASGDEGQVAGMLISYSMPPAMISTFLVGFLYDIIGRRLTLYLAFAGSSVLIYFVPHMAPVVFPNLVLLRMAISVCLVAPIASPLIADYLPKESLGKGAALVGVGFIIGEILSMGILFNITKEMSPNDAFMTVAIIGNVIAFGFLFIVREPLLRKREKDISREEAREQNIRRLSTVNRPDISQIPTDEHEPIEASEPEEKGFTDEAFKSLGACRKFLFLAKLLSKAVREKKVIPVTWCISMVTKTYSILFSTFWLLYILSFIQTGEVASTQEAETIYQYVMIVSVVCGMACVPIVGRLADNVNPQIMLPVSCLFRLSSIVGFYFIEDPKSYYSYGISTAIVLGTLLESICNDAVLFRNADREIRGVIFGTSNAFGFTGQFIFSLVGGYLFDEYGPKCPFLLVGACDLVLFVITALLACCGVITNDIALRKQKEAEAALRKNADQNINKNSQI